MPFYEPSPPEIVGAATNLVLFGDYETARRLVRRDLFEIMCSVHRDMILEGQFQEETRPVRRFLTRLAAALTDEGWCKVKEAIALT